MRQCYSLILSSDSKSFTSTDYAISSSFVSTVQYIIHFFNLILNYIYSTTIYVIILFQLSTVSWIDNQDYSTTVNSVLHVSVIPTYHHLIQNQLRQLTCYISTSTTILIIIPFQMYIVSSIDNQSYTSTTVNSVLHISVRPILTKILLQTTCTLRIHRILPPFNYHFHKHIICSFWSFILQFKLSIWYILFFLISRPISMSKSTNYKPDIVGSHRYFPSFRSKKKTIRKAKVTKQSISKNTDQDAHEPKKIIAMFQLQNFIHTNVHFHQRQRCPFPRLKIVSKFQASPALL